MPTQRQKANAQTDANEKQEFTAKVLRVLNSDMLDRNRITVKVDTVIKSIDKSGAEIDTDSFSFNPSQICNAENTGFDKLNTWNVLLMGEPMNKRIWACILTNATITFEREYLPVGYINSKGVKLTKANYKTTIKECLFNVSEEFAILAKDLFKTQPTEPKQIVVANADDLF